MTGRSIALTLLTLTLLLLPAALASQTVDSILEAHALETAYNPVLLDYLLEEGAQALPDTQRKGALDQLVSALKQDVEITPEEQKTAAMLAAGAALAELLGGSDTSDLGAAAGDATYDVWRGWVDSAITLQRAGYTAEADSFFEKCIEIYPYSDLRGRCAIGLAAGRPDEAVSRLMALTRSSDEATIKAALRLLGRLAGSESLPPATRSTVVSHLAEFTSGLKKASYGQAACQGLVWTGDPGAVPTLQKLSKGMMNADFFRCARRGLLLEFDDTSVVPLLEKQLGGGKFSSTEPWDRFFAATVLMEGGVESGYDWARKEFAKGGAKKGGGFMKKMMSTEKKVDFKPALVNSLVRIGGDRPRRALAEALELAEPGTWLETWIAIGLLELGDASQIELARRALGNPAWEFTTVRVSTALAKHGDYSGIPALADLYEKAARGVEPETGKAVVAFLGGTGDLYLADRGERTNRLLRLRRQIAAALATIDQPESTPVLEAILDASEDSVRSSAAYALARMRDPSASRGLAKAIGLDYGTIGDSSRNPVVHAHLVRSAAALHGGSEANDTILDRAKQSSFASVQFLALCAERGAET
jgi:tetratricopeptide (TPR) repeat protein